MRNNRTYKVVGIDTIRIKMFDGVVRTLTDIRHVSELKKNLISLTMLDFINCSFKAKDGTLWVSKGALVVMGRKQLTSTSCKEARLQVQLQYHQYLILTLQDCGICGWGILVRGGCPS